MNLKPSLKQVDRKMCYPAYKILSSVLLLFMLFSFPTQAVEICASDTSDPDGDAWGWENNMSCHIGPYEPPTFPVCASNDSDTDGDGWGWENSQTCKSDSLVLPGNDFESAGLVSLDKEIGYSISDDGATQYYKFVVNEATGVNILADSMFGFFDYSVVSENDGFYLALFQFEEGVCLGEGTYFFVVDPLDPGTFDYTVTLKTADLNCESPSKVVDTSEGRWWVGDDGSLYRSDNELGTEILTKLDHTGQLLWEAEVSKNVYLVETLESGEVLVFSGIDIQLLDDLGNVVWTLDSELPFQLDESDYSVGGNTLVVDELFEQTVYAINLENGELIWRYDYGNSSNTQIIRVDDNGKAYISTNDGILIFD